jgi:U3 small nucleolar RNA-associated protein 12
VSKTTAETLTAGERIMEALALSDADRAALAEPAATRPARAPQLAATGDPAELYVLKTVQRIPPATLQDALLVLSFSQVGSLLYHVDHWIQRVRRFAAW